MAARFQEMSKKVTKINNKANSSLEQMEYEVKFLEEDTTIKEIDLVVVEVRHLLQSSLITKVINAYQTGSHARHMLKAHAGRSRCRGRSTSLKVAW